MVRFVKRLIAVVFFGIILLTMTSTTVAEAQGANGITSPRTGSQVAGVVTVKGVADHPNFRKWQVDLVLGGEGGHATFLALGEEPVSPAGDFFTWDTTNYPNGSHLLRLRVVHDRLDYVEYFMPLTISNRGAVTYQPPPPPPIVAAAAPEQASVNARHNGERWIEVDISDQRLTAWQGDSPVLETTVSTGKPGHITLPGSFSVYRKYEETRMRGADYDTPDVPWAMYYSGAFAIHGAYWHDDFGTPVSHGCVNLPVADAEKLFKWSDVGTKVVVHY